jgi:hypothetical protein
MKLATASSLSINGSLHVILQVMLLDLTCFYHGKNTWCGIDNKTLKGLQVGRADHVIVIVT